MGPNIWLSEDQTALLRSELERMRDELRDAQNATNDERARLRMIVVQSALLRLENGTYGECVECDEPLSFATFRARPEAALCSASEAARRGGVAAR